MKHVSFKIICLILWACITVFTVSGQGRTVSWESRILESFNGDEEDPYVWKTQASRFATVQRNSDGEAVQDENGNDAKFPILHYVEAFPMAAFRRGPNDDPIRSLGVRGKFDRQGYNWIDLYPALADDEDGKPVEIPIPGRVSSIDCWVWGSNLKYYVEIYLRDYRGVVHPIRLGDISYMGWRNLRISVPTHIPQERRILPSYAGLKFVKFRIWTLPVERVDNFYVYFKQLRVLTDVFNNLFDGSDLGDPDFVESVWSN